LDSIGEETRAYCLHPPEHSGFSSHYPPEVSKYFYIDSQMLTRGASAELSGMNVISAFCREVVGGIVECTA
jgi:hypothetical protein